MKVYLYLMTAYDTVISLDDCRFNGAKARLTPDAPAEQYVGRLDLDCMAASDIEWMAGKLLAIGNVQAASVFDSYLKAQEEPA